MRAFWPPAEGAQADYEALRTAVVAGTTPVGPASARFSRAGLVGLIHRPSAEPVFVASLRGAERPAWSPHVDPRVEALAAGYRLVLSVDDEQGSSGEAVG
ncbi:MAG: hypothetical protein ABR540_18245 [Acidimicrobiales bacterium]